MVKITWSAFALDNLDEIAAYISKDSLLYAERTVQKIMERTQVLKDYPSIGRIVPESGSNTIRELFEGNYRIIYELLSDHQILILTIHHSAKHLG